MRAQLILKTYGEIDAIFVAVRLDAIGTIFVVKAVKALVTPFALRQMITDTALGHKLVDGEVRRLLAKDSHSLLDQTAVGKLLQIELPHPLLVLLFRKFLIKQVILLLV